MPIYNPDGTITTSYTSGGMTTTKTIDKNGRTISEETKPYEQTVTHNADGSTTTQVSPFSKVTRRPTTKTTTATTKDGQVYEFEGDNWVNYANANGLDVGSLAAAITYPSYVNANEANRFLNEQADRYGVDLNNPIGNSTVYSKQEGANLIPDYKTPFASAAAGQTETSYDLDALKRLDQAYLDAIGSSIKVPATSNNMINSGSLNIGTNNSNINNIVDQLGGTTPGTYQGFDYKAYFDDALKSYKDSIEAQRAASLAQFDAARATANDEHAKAAQQAYIANYLANKRTQEQLLESGIKSGLTESSLMQGNANFENAYNQNELARIAAMRDIDMQNAITDAGYSSQLAQYIGDLLLQEAQMGQSENAAANDYYMNQLAMAIDQANADRAYALQLQQLERDKEQDAYNKTLQEIELAYQFGDIERLKALGYDTTLLEAQVQSELNKYAGTGTGVGNDTGNDTGGNDGYIKNPAGVVRNGDGDEISVIYVDGRAYNIDTVRTMLNNGTAYMTNDGTVKMVKRAN